jgi:hypothetical protein
MLVEVARPVLAVGVSSVKVSRLAVPWKFLWEKPLKKVVAEAGIEPATRFRSLNL